MRRKLPEIAPEARRQKLTGSTLVEGRTLAPGGGGYGLSHSNKAAYRGKGLRSGTCSLLFPVQAKTIRRAGAEWGSATDFSRRHWLASSCWVQQERRPPVFFPRPALPRPRSPAAKSRSAGPTATRPRARTWSSGATSRPAHSLPSERPRWGFGTPDSLGRRPTSTGSTQSKTPTPPTRRPSSPPPPSTSL
jgi:hypothetical protein